MTDKNDVGRPTKYKPEYCEEIIQYAKTGYKATDKIPHLEAYAVENWHIAPSTFYKWKEQNREFSEAIEMCLGFQKRVLLNKGLDGSHNSSITKLILMSNHNMTERKEEKQSIMRESHDEYIKRVTSDTK